MGYTSGIDNANTKELKMATIKRIAALLGCNTATAKKIEKTMHSWIAPDWSASSNEDLRIDLLVAAECEGIEIVSA